MATQQDVHPADVTPISLVAYVLGERMEDSMEMWRGQTIGGMKKMVRTFVHWW